MSDNKHLIAVTGIIVKEYKYLITKRSPNKRLFPNMWTVPGGNLEVTDYIDEKKDTSQHWYNVLERVLKREIKEEVGLVIKDIKYLTSMTMIAGENPLLIVSLFADHLEGEVILNEESVDYAWVSLEEAKEYDLIEGIYEELEMLDELLKNRRSKEWSNKIKEYHY